MIQARRRSQSARKESASQGFTLVELLITVVILGLLSTIALPRYTNSVRSARQKDVAGQISNIAATIAAYRQEFMSNPKGWTDISKISPVPTNTGSATGINFVNTITSPNGGHYNITIGTSTTDSNVFNINGAAVDTRSSNWNIMSCLNTQTGNSNLTLGTGSAAAATPVCP
jgi:prepilin-type N-terminal cleavage/methylation domain-containing protein